MIQLRDLSDNCFFVLIQNTPSPLFTKRPEVKAGNRVYREAGVYEVLRSSDGALVFGERFEISSEKAVTVVNIPYRASR